MKRILLLILVLSVSILILCQYKSKSDTTLKNHQVTNPPPIPVAKNMEQIDSLVRERKRAHSRKQDSIRREERKVEIAKTIQNMEPLPLAQVIKIEDSINGQVYNIEVSYLLDSVCLSYFDKALIKATEVKLAVHPEHLFSTTFKQDVQRAVKGRQIYSIASFAKKALWEEKKFELKKADFNFDGYTDLYFINQYGFAQNTGYEVYLFNRADNIFEKNKALSERYWSGMKLDEERKEIIFHNHNGGMESPKIWCKLNEAGELIVLEAVILRGSEGNVTKEVVKARE